MNIRVTFYLIVFLIIIAIPLIFCDFSKDRISIEENRRLANFPELSDIKNAPIKFLNGFDDWFKDSTGFRDSMIKLYKAAFNNQWLNKVRYREGINVYLYGDEGHIYYSDMIHANRDGWLMSIFQGKPILPETEANYFSGKLEHINTYLNSLGIPMLVMLCPNKETVYPEFYPKSIVKGPEPNSLDLFTNYLNENTGATVFNINKALIDQKENFLLFPKRDTLFDAPTYVAHYNQIGAFFGYQELMRHIKRYYPEINIFNLADTDIVHDDNEPNVLLKPENISAINLGTSFFDDIPLDRPYLTAQNAAYENENKKLPTILFLRDSYTYNTYNEIFIVQHFSKTILIHYRNISNIKEYIEIFKPAIVVLEAGERGLFDLLEHLKKMPALF